ncbi:MAG: DUF4234 domain-containing protein [Bacilli bacterium]|nr:DUF4234 domain-containing protein [Bacilli bacterium]
MVTKERNIAVCILLSFVTCGIYSIIWFIEMTDEMRVASGDDSLSGGKDFLLSLVTCGIWGVYWAYKMGQATTKAQEKHNLNKTDNSVLYLILQLFGFSIVNYCLIQNDLNAIARSNSNN